MLFGGDLPPEVGCRVNPSPDEVEGDISAMLTLCITDIRFPSNPESSGSVSFKIPGGENNMEASLVPTKLLLGVSGAEKLSSRGAQLLARLFRALLPVPLLPLAPEVDVFKVGEKFSLSVAALLLGRLTLPP